METYTVPVRHLASQMCLGSGPVGSGPIRLPDVWEKINDFLAEFQAGLLEQGALEEPPPFFEIVIRAQASVLDVSGLPDGLKDVARIIKAVPGDRAYIVVATEASSDV